MTLAIGQQLGPYEITALLGKGGMGEVYRATDRKLQRDAAIKILPDTLARDSGLLARFEREAKILASLNHPNIATVYGLEESRDVQAIAMELVEGQTLRVRGSIQDTVKLALQISQALEAAHEKGVTHRDLKPGNIMVTQSGLVKVLDFGLAVATNSAAVDPENSPTLTLAGTQAGVVLGTAAYMAPEQATGQMVDRRADIWAFGVVLWELLTGERLFQGPTVSHVLANVINQEIPFEKLRADTPAPLLKLLKRCLDRDLHTRLQWIGEARVVLEEYLAHPNSAAIPPIRRTSFMGWLGWICALAIAAATMVFFLTNRQPETTLSTLRYTIALPDDTLLTDQLALSPDGRMLAVITASPAGNRQIFLRPLDSLQGHVLPTTEGAGFPFWSPDSRYIAFFADDKLKRIDVNGGPSETLEQAPSPRGGSWSFAGDIIFSAGSVTESSLQHIASTGGPPHNVPGLTGEVRFPWFLPDGRHFLYTIVQGGTYWASLDGKENRRILSDVSSARFVSGAPNSQKGFILFVRQNSIIAQSFDSASGTLTGDPVSIADGAEVAAGGYASIAVSDRHVLVYQTEHPRTGRLAWFDRSGVATTATEEPGDLGEPEIGPDGKTISFALQRSSFFDIWLWDTLRGTGTRFTLDDGSHHGNVWSPTGDQIVFTASRSGHPYDLSIKPSSGNGPEKSLLETQYSKTVDQWSAIGRLILYAELNPKTKRDVWAVPMETNTRPGKPYPVLQTEFNEVFPQLSPDGKWLAYTSDESGQREVYVQTFPPGDGKWKVSVAGGEQARWRGDGKELYFVNAERKMMMAAVTAMPGPKPIFQAATPVVLFDPHIRVNFAGVTFQYDVTPDGKRFLVASSTDDANTSVLSVVTNFTAALKRDTH